MDEIKKTKGKQIKESNRGKGEGIGGLDEGGEGGKK